MNQSVVLIATIVADWCHRAFVERALIKQGGARGKIVLEGF
jgi:hypothetical protein